MKVDIEHREGKKKIGLFKSVDVYYVLLTVEFSNEEKATIKKRKLEQRVVLERRPPFYRGNKDDTIADVYDITIGRLLEGTNTYGLPSPSDAKDYEAELLPKLQRLKAFIIENTEVETHKKTFEL